MAQYIWNKLTKLELSTCEANGLDLLSGSLKLRRAWPRAEDRLGLEYITSDGRLVPGQWFKCREQLEQVAHSTAKKAERPVAMVKSTGTPLLLHGHGADRRLPGLASLLSEPEAQLLVHQPERRAVVRLNPRGQRRYAKLVRPEKAASVIAKGEAMQKLSSVKFKTPQLLEADLKMGLTVWSPLSGTSLYDLSSRNQLVAAAKAAGRALRSLHAAIPPAEVDIHRAEDEIGVLEGWLKRLKPFDPDLYRQVKAATPPVYEALHDAPASEVLLHRDFYDKQIFIDAEEQIGLLDFDTLAIGEAALDLANALVHFELRMLQGKYAPDVAAEAKAAWLDGYQPEAQVRRRLLAYADAARLRLACVYTFRPHGPTLGPKLLAKVGQALD